MVVAALFAWLAVADVASAWTSTRTSSPVFYIDTGITPQLKGMYVAYQITNTGAAVSDAWAGIASFTGGVVSLAPGEDGAFQLGPMAAGQTKTAFFYLQASAATATAQTHTISVYASRPPGAALFSQSFAFTSVAETIQANANKVTTEVSSPNPPVLGGSLTITVTGETGTIGSAGILSFSPATYLNWPVFALEMTASQITLTGGNTGTFNNRLHLSGMASPNTNYTAVYTFRAVNVTTSPTPVSPVMYGSSGTQIKHTATGGFTALDPVGATTNTLIVTKLATPSRLYAAAGTVTYTLRLTNSGTIPITVDDAVDALPTSPAGVAYVSGTSVFDGAAISDPTVSGATLTWSRQLTIPAGSFRDLTFQANVPNTIGTYVNTAIAHIGTVQIDTTLTLGDNVPATANVVNQPAVDLAVTKSVPAGPVYLGQPLTYTITVANGGPNTATNVSLSDTLPAGVSFVSMTPSQGLCTLFGGIITCGLGSVASGGSATVQVVVTPTATGALTNTASATASQEERNAADNAGAVGVTVLPAADLAIAKSVTSPPTGPYLNGRPLTYTLTVTNGGPSTALAPTVTDNLPAGVTFGSASAGCSESGGVVTCTLANIASGGSASVTITVTPTAVGTITNTASVISTTADLVSSNNATSLATSIVGAADLSIAKIVSSPVGPFLNGQNLTYTLTVSNAGPNLAAAPMVTDSLPGTVSFVSASAGCSASGGVVTCNLADIPSAGSTSVTITVRPTVAGTITNSASVSSTTADPSAANNTTSINTTITPAADLTITKVVTSPAPYLNGQNLTYALTVSNAGPDTAAAPTVTDTLPASVSFVSASAGCAQAGGVVTCTLGAVASGGTRTVSITVTANATGTITNTASVSSTTADLSPTGNTTSVATTITPAADLSVTKAVSSPAAPFLHGRNLTYTVTVANAGPNTAVAPVLTDTLPASVTFVSASAGCSQAGGVVTCTLADIASGGSRAASITVTANAVGAITNSAAVSSTTADPDIPNNTTTLDTTIVAASDLSIAKSVTSPAAGPYLDGEDLTYTVTVTNLGPDTAVAPVVTDTLPGSVVFVSATAVCGEAGGVVTCALADIAAGASASVTVTVTAGAAGTITNAASVSSTTADWAPGNNATSRDTTITAAADLSLTKTVDVPTATVGTDVVFTITLTNDGPDTATDVAVVDMLPAGLDFVSATPATGTTYTGATGVWSVASLARSASVVLSLRATVSAAGALVNEAQVTASDQADPDSVPADGTGDDFAAATVSGVAPRADLSVIKSVTGPAAGPYLDGRDLTYTVTVTNLGPDTAVAPVVTDTLPGSVVFVSASAGCGEAGGVVTCALADIASGGLASATITVTAGAAGTITNAASVASTTTDPVAANNTTSLDTTIDPAADLSITKSVTSPAAGPYLNGGDLTYRLLVSNAGPDTALAPSVSDALPASTTYVSASPGCLYNVLFHTVACTLADIGAAGSATVSVTVTADAAGTITNSATVTSTTADPDTANNAIAVDTPVQPAADLSLTKSVTSPATSPYLNGQDLTYTLVVSNAGPDTALAPIVTDNLPPGVTFQSASAGCAEAAGVVTCTFGDILDGGSNSATITVRPTASGTITNGAVVASSTTDPDSADNAASANTTIVPAANLSVVKAVTSPVGPFLNGQALTYTVTVTNTGPDTAVAPIITDTLPVQVAFTSASAGCSEAAGLVTCALSDIVAGGTASVTITVTATTAGTITNDASVVSTTADSDTGDNATSVDATVIAAADLSITKSVTTPAAGPYLNGQDLVYTVTVANTGPDTAVAPIVTDALPAGVTFVSASAGCSEAGGVVTCAPGDIPSAGSATMLITVTATTAGTITNTASVTATTTDQNPANNSTSLGTSIIAAADLSITKSVTSPAAGPYLNGADLTYTLVVSNAGPDTAVTPTVTDTLPASVTFVSASAGCNETAGVVTCTLGDITSGGSASVTVSVTATTPGTITNTAAVSSSVADPDASDDSTSLDTTIDPAADLSITKSVTSPAAGPYLNGQDLTYTLTVANAGPDTATAPVVTDTLPASVVFVSASAGCSEVAGVVTCTLVDIAPGASATATVTVTAGAVGIMTNTASVASSTTDPDPADNSTTLDTTVDPAADLSIAKSVTSPAAGPYLDGQDLTYTLTISNAGPDTAVAPTVADTLPAGVTLVSASAGCAEAAGVVTCTPADIASGASVSASVTVTASTVGVITNIATVASTTGDPTSANNATALDTTIDPAADLSITKSVTSPAAGPYRNGADLTYTLVVSNAGPDTAVAATVTDTLPASVVFVSASAGCAESGGVVTCIPGDIAAGDSVSITITVTANAAGTVTNTASVASATTDPDTAGNTASANTPIAGSADLSITKAVTAPVGPYLNGADLTYTLTVTNAGPDTAAAPTVIDTLPAGVTFQSASAGCAEAAGVVTCAVPDVASAASVTVSITVTADVAGLITNTASVSSSGIDPNPANNATSVDVTIASAADLSIVKSVTSPVGPFLNGQDLTYTLTVANAGPDTAVAPTVTDALPGGVTFVSASAGCAEASGLVTCTLSDIPAGDAATVTVTVTANSAGTITNTASVASITADPVAADNATSVDTSITAAADLSITKTVTSPAAGPYLNGQDLTYTLAIANTGPDTALAPTATDTLPATVVFVSASAGCAETGGVVTCALADIPSGGNASATITVTANSMGTITNDASVTSTTVDPDAADNATSLDTTIIAAADLSITKSVTSPAAGPYLNGADLTYTLVVSNAGPDTAVTPTVTDTLPASVTFVSASAGCNETAGVVTCTLGDITSGGSASVTVSVTATTPGTITNTAAVSSSVADPDASDDSTSLDTTIDPAADLSITKSVTSPAAGPYLNGQDLTYTLTVANAGPDTAVAPIVTDTLPATVTFVSASAGCAEAGGVVTCVPGDIAAAGAASVTITVTANTAGTITNTASVASVTGDPDPADNATSLATSIVGVADLSITKTVTSPAAGPYFGGADLTYTLTVANAGPDTAVAPTATDTLPGGVSFVPASAGCAEAAGVVTCTLADIASGGSASVTVTVTANATGTITNTASVTSITVDPDVVDNATTLDTTIVAGADLSIMKAVTSPAAGPYLNGQDLTYTVTVSNTGPGTAVSPTITDTLPAAVTFQSASAGCSEAAAVVTCTLADIASGDAALVTVTVTANNAGTITNTAALNSATADPDNANNATSLDTTIAAAADLSITKSVTSPAAGPYLNGADLTYTLTVANAGPDAARAPTVTDTLPAGVTFGSASAGCSEAGGVVTCALADIPLGASASVAVTVTTNTAGSIINDATITSATADPDTANNATSLTTTITTAADLSIIKAVTSPAAGPYLNGQNLTYTLTTSNAGPDTAVAPTITDTLPAGVTFVAASGGCSQGGGIVTCTLADLGSGLSGSVAVTVRPIGAAIITNTATVVSTTSDPDAASNTVSVDTTIEPAADLSLTKSLTAPAGGPYLTGTDITYTISIANAGPDTAITPAITDVLPAGVTYVSSSATCAEAAGTVTCTLADLIAGDSASATITVTPNAAGTLTNTASATSITGDPAPGDNSGSETTIVVEPADLAVSAAVTSPAAPPYLNGQDLTYIVTIDNNGPGVAVTPTLEFTLPTGVTFVSAPAGCIQAGGIVTCALADMASGASIALDIVVTPTTTGTRSATAVIATASIDTVVANDTATVDVTVEPAADLSVNAAVTAPAAGPYLNGQNLTYTLTVANAGPDTANAPVLTVTLPVGVTFASAPAGCNEVAGVVTCALADLASGGSRTIDVVVTATTTGSPSADADVTSTTGDPVSANNTDSVDVTVVAAADLSLTKSVDDPTPNVGQLVTFTITVTNAGPDTATNVQVDDLLPAGFTFASSDVGAAYDEVAGTWTVGTVDPGAVNARVMQLGATVTATGPWTNVAQVAASDQADPDSTPGGGPVGEDDRASASATPRLVDLELTAVVSDATAIVGQNVTYTITLTNNGPDDATAVLVASTLPAGVTFVSASAAAGTTYAAGTWTIPTLAPGAGITLQVVGTPGTVGPGTFTSEVTAATQADIDSTPNDLTGDDFATVDITTAAAGADLSLTNTVDNATPAVGGTVTYTLTVTNNGPSAAGGVSVLDLLPGGVTYVSSAPSTGTYDAGSGTWDVGTLAPGTSATLTITATVAQAGTFANAAEVGTSDVADPDSTPANASGTEDDEARSITATQTPAVVPPPPPAPQSADLQVVKSASASTAVVGDTISYAIVVTNRGPDTATNVQVLEQLPSALQFVSARASVGAYEVASFVWSIPSIPNGGSASLVVTTRVVAPGSVTNTVQILAADQLDPDGPFSAVPAGVGPATASATVVVSGPAPAPTRLVITKSGTKLVKAGGRVSFTIVIRNSGNVPATNVVVSDCIPSGLSLTGRTGAGRLRKNGRLGWQLGTVQPGVALVVRVVMRADRGTRGSHGCTAVASAANAPTVRAGARVRVVAGAQLVPREAVAG